MEGAEILSVPEPGHRITVFLVFHPNLSCFCVHLLGGALITAISFVTFFKLKLSKCGEKLFLFFDTAVHMGKVIYRDSATTNARQTNANKCCIVRANAKHTAHRAGGKHIVSQKQLIID